MPPTHESYTEKTMDDAPMTPMDYLAVIRRRAWSLILPAAVVIIAAGLLAFLLPAKYRSTATILIEEQEVPADFVMTTVTGYAEQRIQSINQRIMSSTRLLEIIQQQNLYPELRERYTTEELVDQMREDIELLPVSADVIDRRTGRPTAATIAFTLSYQGKSAQKAQEVANVLTSLFLSENLKQRVRQVEETSEFLDAELGRVKEDLAGLEARLAGFKEKHINELPEMLGANIQILNNIERNIQATSEQLRGMKEREGYLQSQLSNVKPHVEKDEELVRRRRLEELKIQLVTLTQRFSEEHPDVRKTRAEIAQMEEAVAADGSPGKSSGRLPDNPAYITIAAQLASARVEVQSIQRQLEKLNAEAGQYRRRIAATPRVEEEYNVLLGDRNSAQAKVNDLTRKLMEARMAHGMEKEQKGERFTLIDPPRLPEKPFKPNRLAILLIGAVLGIGAGAAFTALREYSDDAVRSADQLEAATRLPVLAGIPVIVTEDDRSRIRRRRAAWAAGSLAVMGIAVAGFHFWVMDLDVFWAVLSRKLGL